MKLFKYFPNRYSLEKHECKSSYIYFSDGSATCEGTTVKETLDKFEKVLSRRISPLKTKLNLLLYNDKKIIISFNIEYKCENVDVKETEIKNYYELFAVDNNKKFLNKLSQM